MSSGVQKNNFPKHHALATNKQNKQGALPNGSAVCKKSGHEVKGAK